MGHRRKDKESKRLAPDGSAAGRQDSPTRPSGGHLRCGCVRAVVARPPFTAGYLPLPGPARNRTKRPRRLQGRLGAGDEAKARGRDGGQGNIDVTDAWNRATEGNATTGMSIFTRSEKTRCLAGSGSHAPASTYANRDQGVRGKCRSALDYTPEGS